MVKHRKQIRLKKYDYSQSGLYFVTICTQKRECLFGNVVDGKMVLNDVGKIVENVLNSLPNRYKQIELDVSQIMPNHIHMIIIIRSPVRTNHDSPQRRFIQHGDKRELLPQCIGYLKMNSSKQINQYFGVRAHHDAPQHKIFQRNYYEHIIRNEIELNKIPQYIKTNPLFWKIDINNQARL